ncbi:low-density lipoprotein receptor-related protein 2 [Trichonephila inaurata madagascariensis]|uniref:Low-density lipoprotein receptor-related protein 2 n=1 Tax=Trichonephila inaurata madagascariensis TaxID=2747483 RepID=A0A8X7CLF5_9ARAC|nr:low-density lipoprotein receptor-related protein 2 [Trichonephila inaurata madagascariensis]
MIYCTISVRDFCPQLWSRCADNTRCFPSRWLCDGIKDCLDASDEEKCGSTILKTQGVAEARQKLMSWFLQRSKSDVIINKWGTQLHRIAVGLFLANDSIFSPGNRIGQEIRYELSIQLLSLLSKDKKISSQELALYIHALLATCMDPNDFYGENLVQILRRKMEENTNYTNPFQILVLCNAGDTMTTRDMDRVVAAFDSQHRPFWTDTQALSSLALACLSSRPNLVTDEKILKDMLQVLKRRQFRNGTVDNARTTSLVLQALLIHDSFMEDFDLTSALKTVIDNVKDNVSLLNAYYALPVLSNKNLLNISAIRCKKAQETEAEALQKALSVHGRAISVQYSIWIGDRKELGKIWKLKMSQNHTIYDVLETVARIDNRQRVKYNIVEGKPYVASLGEIEDDPETGTFWFIYLRALNSDDKPKLMEQSPVDLKIRPNQEIILWYKLNLWIPRSDDTESTTLA